MRLQLKSWAAAGFAVVFVTFVAGKPPELPALPVVEFKVPLFPLGEKYAEPLFAKPLESPPIAPAPKPVPLDCEALEVMPREIEALTIPPRPEVPQIFHRGERKERREIRRQEKTRAYGRQYD